MRYRFGTKKLEALYTEEKDAHKYAAGVVDNFFDVMAVVESAKDERDFYALKGLRYEKLSGKRKNERSMRLTGRWRLIVEIEQDSQGQCVSIKGIEDYH